jgi:hypothetical protein
MDSFDSEGGEKNSPLSMIDELFNLLKTELLLVRVNKNLFRPSHPLPVPTCQCHLGRKSLFIAKTI